MRRLTLMLLLLCLLTLSGCVHNSYLTITPHNNRHSEKSDAITVRSYAQMRSNLVQQVDQHAAQVSMVTDSYSGDVEQDVQKVLNYIQNSYPLGAYAIDTVSYEIAQVASFYQIQLQLTYTHTAWEMSQITQVRMENLSRKIGEAIAAGRGKQTLIVAAYTPVDFTELCWQYLLENPANALLMPSVSCQIWPDSGTVRVVELRYTYPATAQQLREYRTEVTAALADAAQYNGLPETQRVAQLYAFMQTRYTGWQEAPTDTPAYSVLCQGTGDAASFAAVFRLLCQQVGLDCTLVQGEKNGAAYTWNLLQVDGIYYHVDVWSALRNGRPELPLWTDDMLQGYHLMRETQANAGKT